MFYKFFFITFFFSNIFFSQEWREAQLNTHKNYCKIPFELSNNLIILDVVLNGQPLKMALDSGTDDSLLFSIPNENELELYNLETSTIAGVGNEKTIQALHSSGNSLQIKDYVDTNFEILIISDFNFKLLNKFGVEVNGILGYSFFRDFTVQINYESQYIKVYQHKKNIPPKKFKKYDSIPISIIDKKPYINLKTSVNSDDTNLLVLFDLGLTDGLWLFENDSIKCQEPFIEDNLGFGISGIIIGNRARIPILKINSDELKDVLVCYPKEEYFKFVKKVKGRNGSLGSKITKRYNWLIDYKNSMLYFKKNSFFQEPFEYNMSGMEIEHGGIEMSNEKIPLKSEQKDTVFLSQITYTFKFVFKPIFVITAIRKNSPADLADLKIGDRILKINGKLTQNMLLDDINALLYSKDGREIKLEINRQNSIYYKSFKLKKII